MKKTDTENHFLQWFHEASPYIQAHRGKTFVVCMPGAAIDSPGIGGQLLRDVAGIAHLGIRIVLVHGIGAPVEACLGGDRGEYCPGPRITDDRAMACVEQQVGKVRLGIESRLSRALVNLPAAGVYARVCSGNFITARPYGIHDGIDYVHSGVVRRVDAAAIRHQLDMGAIVLVSPIGYSASGEIFSLSCGDVAGACATALSADKFILLTDRVSLYDQRRKLLRQLTGHEAHALLDGRRRLDEKTQWLLRVSLQAVGMGVRRVHILRWDVPGALLQELFTRDGVGTLISAGPYDTIRTAHAGDLAGIVQIIEPLEDAGVLVKRQRRRLEMEIDHFLVAIRDDAVVGCAAVYPCGKTGMAELACLAMDTAYQGSGGGNRLLDAVQERAIDAGIQRMFVLTTQTAHWFKERGFAAANIDDLPITRRRLYNYRRKSRVFVKEL